MANTSCDDPSTLPVKEGSKCDRNTIRFVRDFLRTNFLGLKSHRKPQWMFGRRFLFDYSGRYNNPSFLLINFYLLIILFLRDGATFLL